MDHSSLTNPMAPQQTLRHASLTDPMPHLPDRPYATPPCRTHILQYVLGRFKPASLSDVERKEGGVVAVGAEIVDTLVETVYIQVTLV